MDECNLSLMLLNGPNVGKKADDHVTSQPRNKAQWHLIRTVGSHRSLFTFSIPTQFVCEIDLVKAQDMDLTFYHTFSNAVVYFGLLYERPSEVTRNDVALQAKMSLHLVSDCWTKINNRKGSISSRVVLTSYSNLKNGEEGTEVDECTAELYCRQGHTDTTGLVVIDETTQCEKCKEHDAEGKPFLSTCGVIL